jgi:Protein of unknown function (DUF4013)
MASSPGTTGGGTVDFGRAFQFYFEDPEWVRKTLIGGGLYLAGTLLLVVLGAGLLLYAICGGYAMRVMQRAYAGDPRPLPDWDDYGGMMRDGLKMLGLSLAYAIVVFGIPGIGFAVLGVAAGAASSAGSDAAGGLMALAMVGMQLIFMVVALVLAIYLPSAIARMTLYQRFGAGFEIKENVALIRRNPANYAIAVVLILLANFVAQIGVVLCCVGFFATTFWSMCVMGFALGDMVRRDPLIGQPLAVAPAPTPGL